MSWGEEEKKMEDITLQEFEDLCTRAYELKKDLDLLDLQKKSVNENLMQVQQKILIHMEAHNKKSYKTQHGTIVAATKFQVTLPKTPEQLEAFYSYLKSRGHFDNLISVNYQKLNSYYKQEMEAAVEAGNIDFKVPGIDEPKAFTQIQMRTT